MSAEHRALDALFEGLKKALKSAAVAPAREELAQLGEELEVHFDREGRLYYPSIWALQPQRKAALSALVAAHEGLLERLDDVRTHLNENAFERAQDALAALRSAFAEHESAEEALLEAIDRDLGDPDAPES